MAQQSEDKGGAVSQPWKPTDTLNLPSISSGLQQRTGQIKPMYLDTGRGLVKGSDRFIRNTDQRLNQFGIQRYNLGLPGMDTAWQQQGQSFWQDSRRIGRYYNALQTLPAGVEAPAWLDADKLKAAYTDRVKSLVQTGRHGACWMAVTPSIYSWRVFLRLRWP